MKEITKDVLQGFRQSYASNKEAQVLQSALAKTDMADLAYVPTAGAKLKGAFSVEVFDPGDYGPTEIGALLALCGPQYPPGKGGRNLPVGCV